MQDGTNNSQAYVQFFIIYYNAWTRNIYYYFSHCQVLNLWSLISFGSWISLRIWWNHLTQQKCIYTSIFIHKTSGVYYPTWTLHEPQVKNSRLVTFHRQRLDLIFILISHLYRAWHRDTQLILVYLNLTFMQVTSKGLPSARSFILSTRYIYPTVFLSQPSSLLPISTSKYLKCKSAFSMREYGFGDRNQYI